jgi:excisionase family DNA binding protein
VRGRIVEIARERFAVATDPTDIHAALTTPIPWAPRAFSIEEFCRRYGVGRTKAYEEIKLGRLQARKIGRRTVILEDDAEAWLRRLPRMKSS